MKCVCMCRKIQPVPKYARNFSSNSIYNLLGWLIDKNRNVTKNVSNPSYTQSHAALTIFSASEVNVGLRAPCEMCVLCRVSDPASVDWEGINNFQRQVYVWEKKNNNTVSLCKNTLQTLMVSVFQKQCCTANYAGSYSALSGEQKTIFHWK